MIDVEHHEDYEDDYEPSSFDEPDEEDYQTSDHSRFYASGKLVLTVDPDASTDEMWSAIDAHMDKEQYWPSVWFVSDHGNAHLMTRA